MTDLVGFERAAYRREPDRVVRMLRALAGVGGETLVEDAAAADRAPISSAAIATRMAAAAAAVFTDPAVRLRPVESDRAFALKGALDRLFQASPFAGADHALRAMDDAATSVKRLALQSLDSQLDLPLETLAALEPRLAQMVVANLIATKPVLTAQGQARRERLLELAADLTPAELPSDLDHLVVLTGAWMLCSYAAGARKHAVKPVFNRALIAFAGQLGLTAPDMPATRPLKVRPVMVVAAEIMHSRHVQYRYFGQYLRQLRTRFDLVLVTEKHEADEDVAKLYDKVLTFERHANGAHLATIVAMIKSLAPDVVFWPSVGMRHWGPLIANLRLAPVQFTALGHSASTFCDAIDYYLLEEGYVSDPALFGETVLTLPDDSLRFERSPHYKPIAPTVRETATPLRVALPSNILKLNPGFLAVMARIKAAAKRPIDFHLLPNSRGLEADAFQAGLHRILPGAHLHRSLPYERYLQVISHCDLNLSPFPFGGLHSVIDSLRQGLPVVAMEGAEPHGRTDAMLLRRLGMPDWLIAHDEDAYVAAALRIIDDDAVRVALSRQALALEIDRLMFGDGTTPLGTKVIDAVWWMYEHHEAIQASGRKLWGVAERAGFSPTTP